MKNEAWNATFWPTRGVRRTPPVFSEHTQCCLRRERGGGGQGSEGGRRRGRGAMRSRRRSAALSLAALSWSAGTVYFKAAGSGLTVPEAFSATGHTHELPHASLDSVLQILSKYEVDTHVEVVLVGTGFTIVHLLVFVDLCPKKCCPLCNFDIYLTLLTKRSSLHFAF